MTACNTEWQLRKDRAPKAGWIFTGTNFIHGRAQLGRYAARERTCVTAGQLFIFSPHSKTVLLTAAGERGRACNVFYWCSRSQTALDGTELGGEWRPQLLHHGDHPLGINAPLGRASFGHEKLQLWWKLRCFSLWTMDSLVHFAYTNKYMWCQMAACMYRLQHELSPWQGTNSAVKAQFALYHFIWRGLHKTDMTPAMNIKSGCLLSGLMDNM